ncbi:HEAT repeat protein [Anaeromyxobacter dehalogenans 2CP-C]|uniref:HEAT repeat protein n=1 Tax=Anaeromyxobacter dehalogenans (strain 2CP-C) TaxID=290397 RepID=Q2IG93_ANADE|nr:HEAT repeat protein [Anaeromyxobacter dehalogenans 2CP-C]
MADGAKVNGVAAAIDPEGLLRSALEKIVFFECRVSQLESELAAARTTAERARADAARAHRREVELEQAAAAERGARADAQAQADDLVERVRLLEGERERLLSGLVERARIGGATGADGAPGPEEGGADLAGFIAELRAEIEALRAWKAAAEAGGVRVDAGGAVHVPKAREAAEGVSQLAGRFEAEGRVGLSGRDTDRMKELLATRADRVLYERSMDDLRAPDARTRQRAVRTLEALGSKAAAPLLAAALGREEDGEVKAALLGALARFKEPFAAPLAERALEDARPAVRVAALEALNAVASGDAEPRLADALSDPSPIVRRRAALLLGYAPGERAEAALSVALGDPDRGVARAAAAALSGRPTARAQGALARALEHPDESVRRAAASALSRVAGERISSDGSAPARRAASRRIAERLAAMDGAALRDAVMAGADALAPARPAQAPARPSTSSRRAAVQGSPRTAVAVAVREAAPADPGLDAGIVGEVRIALRGCTAADLSAVLGAPQPRVDAALAALAARGALVQRGARWFMA